MELTTPRLLLRDLVPDDLAAVHAYARDPEVVRYLEFGPSTPEDVAVFLAEADRRNRADPRTSYAMAIIVRDEGPGETLVGTVHLGITSEMHRRGEVGYVLTRAYWGHGYASEAAAALVQFGFSELGLHKVSATCDPENLGSVGVLEKIGMQREGYLSQHAYIHGEWRDRLLYASIRSMDGAGPDARLGAKQGRAR